MKILRFLIFIILLFQGGVSPARAQFYITGNDPASVRWMQIHTPHLQIIFPKGFEAQAQKLANTLEYLCIKGSASLSAEPAKISVILHTQVARSNGFVTWAPRRMELYTLPSPGQTAQKRLQSLAIHELRHVVQMDQMNREIPKLLKLLFGEQAPGAIAGLLPRWYLEGDAVVAETAISSAGRGRDAFFDMALRAQILSAPTWYNYEKATLGSYRNFVPDQYVLGYHLVSYIREKYGPEVFEKTVERTSRRFYQLFPFHMGLKHFTKKDSRHLLQEAVDSMRVRWSLLNPDSVVTQPDRLWNKPPRVYTDYLSPHYVGPDTVIAWKEGLSDIRQFVLLDSLGNEKMLHMTGQTNSDVFDYKAGLWVWTELVRSARWENRSFSVIKVGNLRSGEIHTISRQTRYYEPSLSPDGTRIVVVSSTPNLNYSLEILDSHSGEILQSIPTPDNYFAQSPVWSHDASEILVILVSEEGKSILRYSISQGQWSTLLAQTFVNLNGLNVSSQYLFFNGVYKEVENIYALRLSDRALFRVTGSRYGAYDADFQPSLNGIFYSDYTPMGSSVASIRTLPSLWERTELPQPFEHGYSESLSLQEGWNLQGSVIPQQEYPVKKYQKLTHAVNIHSWSPAYVNYHQLGELKIPGISFASQDLLGNTLLSGGWRYDGSENLFYAGLTYKGWYPVFDFSLEYGGRPPVYSQLNLSPAFIEKTHRLEVTLQSYIPWVLTRNRFQTGLIPNVSVSINDGYILSIQDDKYFRGHTELNYGLQFYRYLKLAPRDVVPRLGINIFGQYTHNPFESDHFGSILSTLGKIYLPGIGRHHSIKYSLGWQQQKPKKIYYNSTLLFPRGYNERLSTLLSTFSVDYTFPIANPDWSLGFLGYVKRFSGNLFFDFAKNRWQSQNSGFAQYGSYTEYLKSYGAELLTDIHVLRMIFPITTGIRGAYLPIEKTFSAQWLLQIRFSQN